MSFENKIQLELKAIKSNLDLIQNADESNDVPTEVAQNDELRKLKLISSLLEDVSSTIDNISTNITKVDEGLKLTNGLINRWAKILVKNNETSELLLSEHEDIKWKGATQDNLVYKEKAATYNRLVVKYNNMKTAKEERERKLREQQQLRAKKIREREEILQRRVYGNKYRGSRSSTASSKNDAKARPNRKL